VSDQAVIELCDSDAKWGPLLFLRPEQNQALSLPRAAMLALLPGVAFGALGTLVLEAAARTLSQPLVPWYSFPATLIGLYFAACLLIVAPAWNRRAERLVRLQRFRR
jgi:hypothetical protein